MGIDCATIKRCNYTCRIVFDPVFEQASRSSRGRLEFGGHSPRTHRSMSFKKHVGVNSCEIDTDYPKLMVIPVFFFSGGSR